MPAHRKDVAAALRALGTRIAELRRARGMSQETLAWETDIHTNHLSTIERGVANPSVAVLMAIARVLGITLADLVRDIDMTSSKKTKKTAEPEDFNQAAFRIVQQATKGKPKTSKKRNR